MVWRPLCLILRRMPLDRRRTNKLGRFGVVQRGLSLGEWGLHWSKLCPWLWSFLRRRYEQGCVHRKVKECLWFLLSGAYQWQPYRGLILLSWSDGWGMGGWRSFERRHCFSWWYQRCERVILWPSLVPQRNERQKQLHRIKLIRK